MRQAGALKFRVSCHFLRYDLTSGETLALTFNQDDAFSVTINYVPPSHNGDTVINIDDTSVTDTKEHSEEEKFTLKLSKKHQFEAEEDGSFVV